MLVPTQVMAAPRMVVEESGLHAWTEAQAVLDQSSTEATPAVTTAAANEQLDPPAPLVIAVAEDANGANSAHGAQGAEAGDDHNQRLRRCITPQCGKLYLYTRHRHCCSLCRSSAGAAHARRCGALQRALTRQGLIPSIHSTQCSTPECPRGSGNGYRSCCSYCIYGRQSGRCTSFWQSNVPRDATSSFSNVEVTGHETDDERDETATSSDVGNSAPHTYEPMTQHAAEESFLMTLD